MASRNPRCAVRPPSAWLVNLLRCPETGLAFEATENCLIRADGKRFPYREGIVSLVFPPLLSGSDERMNRFYDRIAPVYDFFERVVGRIVTGVDMARGRDEIIALLGLQRGMRLLEVSPGPGVFQPMLRQTLGDRAEIAALDLSFNMLRQCRRQHGDLNIELVHGNALHLPFADESFDGLFHFGGVNLFNDPATALDQFVRVVRKGGVVAWGDEQMSEGYRHPIGRRLLPRVNPGFRKVPPVVPVCLSEVVRHEVYRGLGYLIVARR
jgi:SAM-dependent methyltransferase